MQRVGEPESSVEESPEGSLRWRFAGFELDERRRELRRDQQVVRLEPRPLDLLMLLLRRPNDLVSKDELIEQVWAGRVVTEAVIARAVAKLRAALGDDQQELIRNVHGYGYRLNVVPERSELPASSRSASPLRLQPGDQPPLRPNWKLLRLLSSAGNAWLVEQTKSGQRRVFKFAAEPAEMHALKREITLHRVLRSALGDSAPVVPLLDWNLDESPWYIETEYCPLGSLQDWFVEQSAHAPVPLAVRLELLAQAAEALARAHVIGVLHKDLKPANLLLVEREGRLQVLLADFGSGRIDSVRLAAHDITRLGFSQTIAADDRGRGTLSYLAPEVLGGQAATTKSDVYALGVMLFQLLVGDLRRPLAPGWEREVEDELLRQDIAAACDLSPSHRLGDAGELALRLRQIDTRREALATSRAAEAERQRVLRLLEQSASRRRWVWALTGSLALGLLSTGGLYWRARSAQQEAHRETLVAQAINDFLNNDMLGAANPYLAGGGRDVTVSSVLDEASARLDRRFSEQPQVYAAVSRSVAAAYQNLGLEAQAGERLRRAMDATRQTLGEDSDEYDGLRAQLSELDVLTADFAEAQRLSDETYRFRRRHYGEKDMRTARARDSLAWLLYEFGDYAESARRYEQLIDELKGRNEEADNYILDLKWYLAEDYLELGRFDRTRDLINGVIAHEQARLGGPDNLRMYWLNSTLGDLQMQTDQLGDAEQTYGQMLTSARATLGPAHPNTLRAEYCLGLIRFWQGDRQTALPLLQAAYAGRLKQHGEAHYYTRYTMAALGEIYLSLGRYEEALRLLERAYSAAVQAEGEAHPRTLALAHSLALARAFSGELGSAETLLLRSLALAKVRLPANNLRIGWMHYRLGLIHHLQGRTREAKEDFVRAHEVFLDAFGERHTLVRMATEAVAGKIAVTRDRVPHMPAPAGAAVVGRGWSWAGQAKP